MNNTAPRRYYVIAFLRVLRALPSANPRLPAQDEHIINHARREGTDRERCGGSGRSASTTCSVSPRSFLIIVIHRVQREKRHVVVCIHTYIYISTTYVYTYFLFVYTRKLSGAARTLKQHRFTRLSSQPEAFVSARYEVGGG